MRFAQIFAQLVLLSFLNVVHGISSCLDPTSSDYACAGTTMILTCAVDDDIATALPACFDAPSGGRASVTTLNFMRSALTTLPAGLFEGMTSMENLIFFGSALSTLEAGCFDGLESLDYLDVTYNRRLTSLPNGLFSGLDKLMTLDFEGSNLSSLQAGVFLGLPLLDELILWDNQPLELEAGAFQGLPSLRTLKIFQLGLTTIPAGLFDGFEGSTSLETISLDQNYLSEVPVGLFQGLSALKRLWLDSNMITTLEEGVFEGLTSLEQLDISGNELTTLPAGIFQGLTALQQLPISFNGLTTLPAGLLSELAALETLDLRYNEDLQCVPSNTATDVFLPEGFVGGTCGCEPTEAVICDDGLLCEPGINGYICAGSFCSNGLPGVQTDNFCCLAECGTCGGSGCKRLPGGPEGCCKGAIEDSAVMCNDSGAAPCIIEDESICSNGIPGVETDNYCCLKECGTCGGSGCRNRPGGKEGCCKGAIDDAGVLCDDSGAAPCIMTSAGSFCSNGLPGVQTNSFCCLEECGTCGGSGCRSLPGGAEGCCKGVIEDSAVMCSISESAPCIIDDE